MHCKVICIKYRILKRFLWALKKGICNACACNASDGDKLKPFMRAVMICVLEAQTVRKNVAIQHHKIHAREF